MSRWIDWLRLVPRSPSDIDIFRELEISTEDRALSVLEMIIVINRKHFFHVYPGGMYVKLANLERSGAVLSRFVDGPYPRKRVYWLNRDSLSAEIPRYVKNAVRGAQVAPDEIG